LSRHMAGSRKAESRTYSRWYTAGKEPIYKRQKNPYGGGSSKVV